MIKHHPTDPMLQQFSEGSLSASLAAAVAIHQDMCEQCRHKVNAFTESLADASFAEINDEQHLVIDDFDMEEMIDAITDDLSFATTATECTAKTVTLGETNYTLHPVLRHMDIGSAKTLGKVSRAPIELGEGQVHTHLLEMAAGGKVPKHTHKGFEVTLLLQGSFSDEMGQYQQGDFMLLDKNHTHQPYSTTGCICLTVVSDALQFTEGFNRLLNPLGKYIY